MATLGEPSRARGVAATEQITATGTAPMSQVLAEFIEPWGADAATDFRYRALVSMAVFAWNLSLLPEQVQEQVLATAAAMAPAEVPEFRAMIEELLERKRNAFAQDQRFIASYDVSGPSSKRVLVVSVAETCGGMGPP